jgi:hypothetical protein
VRLIAIHRFCFQPNPTSENTTMSIKLSRIAAALTLLAGVSLGALPAAATAFCNIKPTADGFVALRAAPSTKARIIARMTADDEVLIGQRRRGKWDEVTWWRGQDRLQKGFGASSGIGWVHRDLLEVCG